MHWDLHWFLFCFKEEKFKVNTEVEEIKKKIQILEVRIYCLLELYVFNFTLESASLWAACVYTCHHLSSSIKDVSNTNFFVCFSIKWSFYKEVLAFSLHLVINDTVFRRNFLLCPIWITMICDYRSKVRDFWVVVFIWCFDLIVFIDTSA